MAKYMKKELLNEDAIRSYLQESVESGLARNVEYLQIGFIEYKKKTVLFSCQDEQLLRDIMCEFAETCGFNIEELNIMQINCILRIINEYAE